MSTPIIEFLDKNDMILEIYKGVGGIAFYSHKKGEKIGSKVWLSGNECRELIENIEAWIESFKMED